VLQLERVRRVDRDRHHAGVQAAEQGGDEREPGRIDEHGAVARTEAGAAAEITGDRAGLGGELAYGQAGLVAAVDVDEGEERAVGVRLEQAGEGVKQQHGQLRGDSRTRRQSKRRATPGGDERRR
jgi:hypothetical protein